MTSTLSLTTFDAVSAALNDLYLVPPPPPTTIGCGALAMLRGSMARFSSAESHRLRRLAVVAAIDAIDLAEARDVAFECTPRVCAGGRVDLVDEIAFAVPSATMLKLLSIAGDHGALIADIGAIAAVIGRGAESTPDGEMASERVLAACSADSSGTVPVVSILYQNCDATAALVIESLLARHRHTVRAAAVTRTTRVATADVTIDDVTIPAGATVALDLASSGLEFGAGPHECPGRSLAEAIVNGIIGALDAARFKIIELSPAIGVNGRPESIVMGTMS